MQPGQEGPEGALDPPVLGEWAQEHPFMGDTDPGTQEQFLGPQLSLATRGEDWVRRQSGHCQSRATVLVWDLGSVSKGFCMF